MGRFQSVFRILFPAILGVTLLSASLICWGWFFPSGSLGYRVWVSPLLLSTLILLLLACRKQLVTWISPNFVLGVSVPILILLLVAYLALPDSQTSYGSALVKWTPPAERKQLDLSGTFETLTGRKVSLKHFQDKILFLNMWFTWCGPCRVEMPHMTELYQELSQEGLSMIAVTSEDRKTVRKFMKTNPYPFTILLDPKDILRKRFQIVSFPTTLVIDPKGRLVATRVGSYPWNSPEITGRFRQLLHE